MACFKGFGPLNVIPGASPHRHSRVATFGYQGQMTERSALKAYEDDCESRSANQSDVAGESREPSRSRSRALSLTPGFSLATLHRQKSRVRRQWAVVAITTRPLVFANIRRAPTLMVLLLATPSAHLCKLEHVVLRDF